jgi:hypothetical protein
MQAQARRPLLPHLNPCTGVPPLHYQRPIGIGEPELCRCCRAAHTNREPDHVQTTDLSDKRLRRPRFPREALSPTLRYLPADSTYQCKVP